MVVHAYGFELRIRVVFGRRLGPSPSGSVYPCFQLVVLGSTGSAGIKAVDEGRPDGEWGDMTKEGGNDMVGRR